MCICLIMKMRASFLLICLSFAILANRASAKSDAAVNSELKYHMGMANLIKYYPGLLAKKKPCIGDNDCCSARSKCGYGEGDCDYDHDCVGDLVCKQGKGVCDEQVPEVTAEFHVRTVVPETKFSSTDSCCLLPREMEEAARKFVTVKA